MSERNIYQRINDVMKEVTYVKKDKQVSGGGANYKAVTHDQVVSVARESLVNHGVVVYPEQLTHSIPIMRDPSKDIKMHLYSGDYAIHFVNIDNPEDRITATINAQANDNGDKAPGKAITYATKTAILKVLCLETGEDDESRAEARATITDDQRVELEKGLSDTGSDSAKFCQAFGISTIQELPAKSFKRAQSMIEAKKQKAAE